jgi:hypothetical protein
MRADPESGVAVLVHELTHALGFTDDMFDKFIDASGQPIPKPEVVQRYVDPYQRTTAMVITPTVVKEVRAQFGCDTLPGAALENEGGQGSANAHWEYRWFQVGFCSNWGGAGWGRSFCRDVACLSRIWVLAFEMGTLLLLGRLVSSRLCMHWSARLLDADHTRPSRPL